MSDAAEPLDLGALREMAQRQADAYATMLHIGEGVGGLGIRWPSKLQYMHDWSDATENDHADTVLALLAEVEHLRKIAVINRTFTARVERERDEARAEVDRLRAETDDAWAACGGRDLAETAEVSFGPAGSDLAVVEPSRERSLGEFLRSVERGMRAREQAHRAALTTARRDALTEAAEAYQQSVEHPYASRVQAWLRARAAQKEESRG